MARRSHAQHSPPEPSLVPGTKIKIDPRLVPLLVDVARVRPDPRNPRRLKSLDGLRASVAEFGVRRLVVVNEPTGEIEAGHQLYAVLREAGATEVPVLWASDDRKTSLRYMLADNRTAELTAEWDDDLLRALAADDADVLADTGLDALLNEGRTSPPTDLSSRAAAGGFGVIVDVPGEAEQGALLAELEERGFTCRLLMS